MFDDRSRYAHLPVAFHVAEDGRRIAYVKRRFLPPGETLPVLVEVEPLVGDRLDLIAGRTLGDPEQYWQVCDANDAMNPFDLVRGRGRHLRVPIPQFQVER